MKWAGHNHRINIFHVQQAAVVVKRMNAGGELRCFIATSRINIGDRY